MNSPKFDEKIGHGSDNRQPERSGICTKNGVARLILMSLRIGAGEEAIGGTDGFAQQAKPFVSNEVVMTRPEYHTVEYRRHDTEIDHCKNKPNDQDSNDYCSRCV